MEAAAHTPGGYGGVPQAVGKEFVAADSGKETCAGMLIRCQGKYLLVLHAQEKVWVQPGGHAEASESLEQTAIREVTEEVGSVPEGPMWVARTSESDGVRYTAFVKDCKDPFPIKLDDESLQSGWFAPDALPENTHPEVRKTIEALSGNELHVAKAIQSGELASPQQYENIWLFDVRITGTGTSYRPAHEEIVYRPPENFLSEEFVERCNGLPLIFEHPTKSAILNTEEFRDRSIGTVILPYIKGDEVWGIAKVFDADAAALMQTTHASTSPAVVFRDAGSTETVEVDGQSVLIEGKPSYLDHLAICEAGVWDKGGEPSGVNLGDSQMDEDKVPAWADGLKQSVDSLHARMDMLEKGKAGDQEEVKPDDCAMDARKDADGEKAGEREEREEKEAERDLKKAEHEGEEERREEKSDARKDSEPKKEERMDARADSAVAAEVKVLREQIASLTRPLTSEDREALAQAQARADGLAQLFGKEVSAPLHGESPIAYRKRLAAMFQPHSAKCKAVKLDSLDGVAFELIEEQIYGDALAVARSPAQNKAGVLIPIVRRDSAGRQITTYEGDIGAWMKHFTRGPVITRIARPNLNMGA